MKISTDDNVSASDTRVKKAPTVFMMIKKEKLIEIARLFVILSGRLLYLLFNAGIQHFPSMYKNNSQSLLTTVSHLPIFTSNTF